MTEIATPSPHRVGAAIGAARGALAAVAEAPLWSMDAEQVTQAVDDVAALEAQVAVLRSRLIVHAETIEATGSTRTAAWLARRHHVIRPEANRQTRLAHALDAHPATATAMDRGAVNAEQALVITAGVDALPGDLDPDLKAMAEDHLVGLAADYDAKALKNLARTILEVVAPDLADEHLAKQLEQDEQGAEEANRVRIWDTPDGRVKGTFDLDTFSGACLKKALFALSSPKHRASKGALGDRLPAADRLGQAFAEYVRRYPTAKLPKAGGLNATVVVLMDYDTLLGGIKAAKLDTGEHISAGLARRIACDAAIIPAVLGGKSEVLDLGRSKRFHSRAQRIKATIEHGGCIAEGHDCPPAFTQMHHPNRWALGGNTDGDGQMLCPPAHRQIHDPRYTHELLPNGKIRFHRRT